MSLFKSFLLSLIIFYASGAGAYSGLSSINEDANFHVGLNQATPGAIVDIKEPNAFTKCYRNATDYTTNCNQSFGTQFPFLVNTSDAGYFGFTTPFSGIQFTFSQYAKATLPTIVAQYWNGTAWTNISGFTDNTNQTQNDGAMTWTASAQTGWATTSVNSSAQLYFVKITTSVTPSLYPQITSAHPFSTGAFNVYGAKNDTTPVLSVNNGTVKVNGSSVAPVHTISICSSNTTTGTQSLLTGQYKKCDFTTNGVQDQIIFSQAIAACGTGNCFIEVADGNYNILTNITFTSGSAPASLHFKGAGQGVTTFTSPSTISGATFLSSGYSSGALMSNYTFEDFTCTRNDTKGAGGVAQKCFNFQYTSNLTIQRVTMQGAAHTCLGADFGVNQKVLNNTFINCGSTGTATGNSSIGIGTNNVSGESYVIANNTISGNSTGYGGILMEGQSNTNGNMNCSITGNTIYNVGLSATNSAGIIIKGAPNCVISGNYVTGSSAYGLWLLEYSSENINNTTVVGNVFTNNAQYGMFSGTLSTSSNLYIAGNNVTGNTTAASSGVNTSAAIKTFANLGDTSNYVAQVLTGTAPNTVTAGCGTSATVAGNDNSFVITTGSGSTSTTCGVTFNTAATTNPPICTAVSNATADASIAVSTTTSAITITKPSGNFATASKINVTCNRWL